MKILITGGAGFIGSHLVEHFQQEATEIRILDNLSTGSPTNLTGLDYHLIEGSITDPVIVREAVQDIDCVFHLAAMVSVAESMDHADQCTEINVHGLLNVAREAAAAGIKKIIFASSAAVYGDNPATPKVETMLPQPKSPYAVTKLDGEYYLEMFRSEGAISSACLRFFNVFGPRQSPSSHYAAAVPIFMQQAVRGEDLIIHGDGEQSRDFIYIKDIVGALVFAAKHENVQGIYNAGYGRQTTINELADSIITSAASASRVRHEATRQGDVRHSLASIDKLTSAGWRAQFDLEQGLEATMAYFQDKNKLQDKPE